MRYLMSLVMLAVGVLFIWKTDGVVGTFGRVGWAEQHLGGAGTYTFYKILGTLLIILAMLTVTGIGSRILESLVGGFFTNLSGGEAEAP